MSLINKEIGEFTVQAYHEGAFKAISKADVLGKWAVFFFYPADFTFVCPTELEDLAEKYPEIIQEVRGTGLMLAVEFHTSDLGYECAKGLFARRVLTAGTLVNAKTIRFEPTAVISEQDMKDVISRMDEALADVKKAM